MKLSITLFLLLTSSPIISSGFGQGGNVSGGGGGGGTKGCSKPLNYSITAALRPPLLLQPRSIVKVQLALLSAARPSSLHLKDL